MILRRTPLLAASMGLLALGACVNSQTGQRDNARTGALIGAGVGALAGGLDGSHDSALRSAAIGAAIGAGTGAVAGSFLDRQAQELRNDFSQEIDVINTGNELIVRMPQDILFAVDSASVGPTLQGDLRVLGNSLNRYPSSNIEVQGHTDNTGSAAYNQNLSERRAESVAAILEANGVSPRRVSSVGYGENQPLASNLSPQGRAQNRRVQIIIRPTS
ncbi:outer membrane protein OmpA-like peptidoglycan-associated protein [Palleronia aestuarii]|uniref:Outer membrane protein OmpA-like peptidoglycan-associated protein n=1 Tax=Palleronia aestuarii TaxID=568105 RepID=A0A2W7NR77_9RHOB|nr:OmpA family protein [Palleronia aestuarii]PZX15746.1 outer membrane protein OmpA-like peptidoglycan-associated protein [Palleronia aestuarii]